MPRRNSAGQVSNPIVIAQRVETVLRLLIQGFAFPDVQDHAHEAGWNVSDRQLTRYIAKAKKLQDRRNEKAYRINHGLAVARALDLHVRAMNAQDFSAMARAQEIINKLQNNYPEQQKAEASPAPFVLNVQEMIVSAPKPAPAAIEDKRDERTVIVANHQPAPCPTAISTE
jgi:hypothetical protein